MPDTRKHRGQHPSDSEWFRPKVIPLIREAVHDYSWLLSRGYPEKAALKLVGDRFQFNKRQLKAIQRCSCSDESLKYRQEQEISPDQLEDQSLIIDGYNQIITIESALSGGLLFIGRDGCYRDLASIHGSYRRVEETIPAIELIGTCLSELEVQHVLWYVDRPVSNSGRLKTFLYETATENDWNWDVELVYSPDKQLLQHKSPIVTADSGILDEVADAWFNLTAYLVPRKVPDAQVLDLSASASST